MTRSELASRLAQQNPGMSQDMAEAVVRAIFGRISDALAAGDRVELRDFARFSTKRRDARKAFNPKTGARVDVGSRVAISFRPGKGLRARLSEEADEEFTRQAAE